MTTSTIDYAKLAGSAADTYTNARDAYNHATLHDLISRWNEACDETFISNSDFNFTRTSDAAAEIGRWYEDRFRENRSYRNEERMRYWRYIKEEHRHDGGYYRGDGYAWQKVADIKDRYIWFVRRHGKFGGLTSGEEAALAAIGLVLAVGSPAFFCICLPHARRRPC